MNNKNAEVILKDSYAVITLKEMILEKAIHYDEVSLRVLDEGAINHLLTVDVNYEGLEKVFRHYDAIHELALIKRDLSSMCYQLNKSNQKIPDNTKWERAYQYATQEVRINYIVSNLLGLTNFNKNIPCPFHNDKSPSLKIYTKNNRFVCFGCGARGSPIDFVMKNKNCSFREAVLYISNL